VGFFKPKVGFGMQVVQSLMAISCRHHGSTARASKPEILARLDRTAHLAAMPEELRPTDLLDTPTEIAKTPTIEKSEDYHIAA
jgi:hypothetical protein